jgi:hypothetical protein
MTIEWSNSSFECKLLDWSQYREEIKNDSTTDKMVKTARFFSNTPYGKRTIDYYSPETWPDAWTMLNCNVHCLSTTSLMMYYTLKFVGVDTILLLINDGREDYLVPYHEETDYLLNFNVGSIALLKDIEDVTILDRILL